jgi:hypothetical protein
LRLGHRGLGFAGSLCDPLPLFAGGWSLLDTLSRGGWTVIRHGSLLDTGDGARALHGDRRGGWVPRGMVSPEGGYPAGMATRRVGTRRPWSLSDHGLPDLTRDAETEPQLAGLPVVVAVQVR